MKPEGWDDMPMETRRDIARALFGSMRGNLIMGQALGVAVAELRKAEHPQTSNIEDMEIIGETLFQPWFDICHDIG